MTIFGEYIPPAKNADLDEEPDYFDVKADWDMGVLVKINDYVRFGVTSNQARLLALELLKRADESDYLFAQEQITP